MADTAVVAEVPQRVALPLHLQRVQQLLNLSPLLDHIEKLFAGSENGSDER